MITLDYINSVKHYDDRNYKVEIRIDCPECGDNKGHMYCNLEKMVYVCHRCGARGKIKSEYEPDISKWNENQAKIMSMINPEFEKSYLNKPNQVKTLPICKSIDMDSISQPDLTASYYLSSRGVTKEEVRKYRICVSLEKTAPYRNTIIFPIYFSSDSYDKDNLVYFVARKYDDSSPKYVNAPWPKGDTIFKAYSNTKREIVICEGIFDALAIARAGFNAMALLGKIATKEQLYRLYTNNIPLIIYLDFDAFTHSINLKLQLMALGIKSEILKQTHDAADLYMRDKKQLEVELNEASARLAKNKKQ